MFKKLFSTKFHLGDEIYKLLNMVKEAIRFYDSPKISMEDIEEPYDQGEYEVAIWMILSFSSEVDLENKLESDFWNQIEKVAIEMKSNEILDEILDEIKKYQTASSAEKNDNVDIEDEYAQLKNNGMLEDDMVTLFKEKKVPELIRIKILRTLYNLDLKTASKKVK